MNKSCCKVLVVYLASHLRSCVLHLVSISTELITQATHAFIGRQGNVDSGAVVASIA